MIDWMLRTAHRLNDLPEGWLWCIADAEAMEGDYIALSGAVPLRRVTRGPRKGRPVFPPRSKLKMVAIRRSDVRETQRLWSEETGKCANCEGEGMEAAGWSRDEGRMTRPCHKCGGVGTADAMLAERAKRQEGQ